LLTRLSSKKRLFGWSDISLGLAQLEAKEKTEVVLGINLECEIKKSLPSARMRALSCARQSDQRICQCAVYGCVKRLPNVLTVTTAGAKISQRKEITMSAAYRKISKLKENFY